MATCAGPALCGKGAYERAVAAYQVWSLQSFCYLAISVTWVTWNV